jgi:hypothetical protein
MSEMSNGNLDIRNEREFLARSSYIIEEKKLNNNSLVKVATPYIGNEDPIELTVDEQHLKIMNPNRANVNIYQF